MIASHSKRWSCIPASTSLKRALFFCAIAGIHIRATAHSKTIFFIIKNPVSRIFHPPKLFQRRREENASSTNCACSTVCFLANPVAVEALAGLLIYRIGKPPVEDVTPPSPLERGGERSTPPSPLERA